MNDKKAVNKKNKESVPAGEFLFGKENYIIMAAAVAIIFIGFYLMSGKENILTDTTKITVAPILVLSGFVVGLIAIMKPKKNPEI